MHQFMLWSTCQSVTLLPNSARWKMCMQLLQQPRYENNNNVLLSPHQRVWERKNWPFHEVRKADWGNLQYIWQCIQHHINGSISSSERNLWKISFYSPLVLEMDNIRHDRFYAPICWYIFHADEPLDQAEMMSNQLFGIGWKRKWNTFHDPKNQ